MKFPFWFDRSSKDSGEPRGRPAATIKDVPEPPPGAVGGLAAEDGALLERLRANDERALETIVLEYTRLLTSIARRYTEPREADDLVQDVFVRLWELRAALNIRTTLRAYLVTAVRNNAVSRLRHVRTEQDAAESFAFLGESPGSGQLPPADRLAEDSELAAALREAFTLLPPRTRHVALLRWRDRLSRDEIAEVMGTSAATVSNQIQSAARTLRTRLAKFLE